MTVYNGPSGHGSWQYYNFYGPYANAFTSEVEETQDFSNQRSSNLSPEAQQPFVPAQEHVIKTITLKVLSPSNKRDFTVFTLRDVAEEDMET